MSDLIDRNAAIDAVESFDILDGYTDQQELIYRIRQLPSAQPEPCWQVTGKLEPCKDALDDAYAHGYTAAEAKFYQWQKEHTILPDPCADAVKTVKGYCRDCFWHDWIEELKCGVCCRDNCIEMDDDDFCSRWEKEEKKNGRERTDDCC